MKHMLLDLYSIHPLKNEPWAFTMGRLGLLPDEFDDWMMSHIDADGNKSHLLLEVIMSSQCESLPQGVKEEDLISTIEPGITALHYVARYRAPGFIDHQLMGKHRDLATREGWTIQDELDKNTTIPRCTNEETLKEFNKVSKTVESNPNIGDGLINGLQYDCDIFRGWEDKHRLNTPYESDGSGGFEMDIGCITNAELYIMATHKFPHGLKDFDIKCNPDLNQLDTIGGQYDTILHMLDQYGLITEEVFLTKDHNGRTLIEACRDQGLMSYVAMHEAKCLEQTMTKSASSPALQSRRAL